MRNGPSPRPTLPTFGVATITVATSEGVRVGPGGVRSRKPVIRAKKALPTSTPPRRSRLQAASHGRSLIMKTGFTKRKRFTARQTVGFSDVGPEAEKLGGS